MLKPKSSTYYKTCGDLKPCPFCGREVIWSHFAYSGLRRYRIVIECLPCQLQMDLRDLSAPLVSAEDIAIKEWNKRKEDEQ